MRINDLESLAREAAHRTFDLLTEEGCNPSLIAEDGSLVLRTEGGSVELLIVLGARQTAIGVECARIVAAPGIGEDSVDMAVQLAGIVVDLVREDVCQDMAEEE